MLPMTLACRMERKTRTEGSWNTGFMIFPRLGIFGEYDYQMDFGWVNDFEVDESYREESTWQVGLEYVLGRNFSLMGSYDNRFGAGGGLSIRF